MYIYEKLELKKDYIISSYNLGISTNKLGNEFNCNAATIHRFLENNGVQVRKRIANYGILDNKKDLIIKYHAEGKSAKYIAKQLGVSYQSILNRAKKWGISFSEYCSRKNPLRMKEQQDLILSKLNDGYGCKEMAEELGYSPSRLSRFVTSLGYHFPVNTYDVDLNFFKKIDNEIKAYVLGFFGADGSVDQNNNGFKFQIADLDLLERIKEELGYTGPIIKRKNKRKEHHKDLYTLSIRRKEMGEDLARLGYMNRKTFLLEFPTNDIVPDGLMPCYLRGYIDGDGNVSHYAKRNSLSVKLIGNEQFIKGYVDYVSKKVNVHLSCFKKINNYVASVDGNLQSLRFLDYIYKDATIYLDRKYQIYNTFRCNYLGKQEKILPISQKGVAGPCI